MGMQTTPPSLPLTDWLLAADTPSIRYLTGLLLLDAPANDPALQADRLAIMHTGPVPSILARQTQNGAWGGETSYYTPKYTSSHWSMLMLAELHADPQDPRLRAGAISVIERLQSLMEERLQHGQLGWECLCANVLRYSAYAGVYDHPGFAPIVALLVASTINNRWRCNWSGDGPCAWSAARTLWAFAALPPALRTPQVQAAIDCALDFLLVEHSLYPASYPAERNGKSSDLWRKLTFPLFYQVDVLFVLRTLAELGRLDHPGAAPALAWLAAQRKDGRWRCNSQALTRSLPALRHPEDSHRWISLYAAWVLARAG